MPTALAVKVAVAVPSVTGFSISEPLLASTIDETDPPGPPLTAKKTVSRSPKPVAVMVEVPPTVIVGGVAVTVTSDG